MRDSSYSRDWVIVLKEESQKRRRYINVIILKASGPHSRQTAIVVCFLRVSRDCSAFERRGRVVVGDLDPRKF